MSLRAEDQPVDCRAGTWGGRVGGHALCRYSGSKHGQNAQQEPGGGPNDDAAASKQKELHPIQDASVSKQKQGIAGAMDGCPPRGESMPSVSRLTDALLFGMVGFLGMLVTPFPKRHTNQACPARKLRLRSSRRSACMG